MSHKGFARGDFDTGFDGDQKFVNLARDLPLEEYLEAVGAYYILQAATWREGSRVAIRRVIAGVPDRTVAALHRNRLIGADGRIPAGSFQGWVGKAIERRGATADRVRKHRERVSTSQTEINENPQPIGNVTRTSRARQDRTGTTSEVPTETEQRTEGTRDDFDASGWVAVSNTIDGLTGRAYSIRSPYSALAETARHLAADFGLDAALAAFRRAAHGIAHPDASQIVLGANRALRPLRPASEVAKVEAQDANQRRIEASAIRLRAERAEYEEWVAAGNPRDDRADAGPRRYDGLRRAVPTPQVGSGGAG